MESDSIYNSHFILENAIENVIKRRKMCQLYLAHMDKISKEESVHIYLVDSCKVSCFKMNGHAYEYANITTITKVSSQNLYFYLTFILLIYRFLNKPF